MTDMCPTCGAALIRNEFERKLDGVRLPKTFSLVCDLLARHNGRSVRHEVIVDEIYGLDPNGGPDDPKATIKVHISKYRKRLNALGLDIRTHWAFGLYIVHIGEDQKCDRKSAASRRTEPMARDKQ